MSEPIVANDPTRKRRSALLLVKGRVMSPESTLSAPERLTALAVADHMREVEPSRFECFVSVTRLAALTGLSTRSVRRALDALCYPTVPLFTRRRRKSSRGLGCFIFSLVLDPAALLEARTQGAATVADADEPEGVATVAAHNLSDDQGAESEAVPGLQGVASVATHNLAPEVGPRAAGAEGEATVACPDWPGWPRGTSYVEPVTDNGALTGNGQHPGSLNEGEPADLLEVAPGLCARCGGEALAEFDGRLLCWRHAPRQPEAPHPNEPREEDSAMRSKPLPDPTGLADYLRARRAAGLTPLVAVPSRPSPADADDVLPEGEPEAFPPDMQPEGDAGPPALAAPQGSAERRAAQAAFYRRWLAEQARRLATIRAGQEQPGKVRQ